MAENRGSEQAVLTLPAFNKLFCSSNISAWIRNTRSREVDDTLGRNRPNTALSKGLRHLVFKEVTVRYSCCSREDHFSSCKFCTPVDHLRVDAFGLSREDMLMKPSHEGQVISHSPEQGHGCMGVGVDQAGYDEVAAAVNNSIGRTCAGEIGHDSQSHNFSSPDGDIAIPDKFGQTRGQRQQGAVGDQNIISHSLHLSSWLQIVFRLMFIFYADQKVIDKPLKILIKCSFRAGI